MNQPNSRKDQVQIEPLLPQKVRNIRIPWWSFFDQRTLVQHLLRFPGISFHVADENQYILGSYWRGRPEVGLVLEITGSKNRAELVDQAVESFRKQGCGAVVLSSEEANRSARWFLQQGWEVLDEIVVYTRRSCHLDGLPRANIPVEEFRPEQMNDLLSLEHGAFPYLWWSGREDFLQYAALPEVRAFVLYLQNRMAGYASFTLRSRQGYLDRLAVDPAFQGQGYGSQLLSFALEMLDRAGARAVSLNTQVTNYRSQNLYRSYGFIRTNNVERIYGRWLKSPEDLEVT